MASEHLYPCQNCEASFTVEVAQAGRTLPCPFCGESQQLPKLSEIRRLAPTHEKSDFEITESKSKMGLAQTWMFVAGLPLVLIGSGVGAYQLMKANEILAAIETIDTQRGVQKVEDTVDGLAPESMWALWHDEILENPPGVWEQPAIVYGKQQAGARRLISYVSFGAAGIGLLLIVAAIVTGRKPG